MKRALGSFIIAAALVSPPAALAARGGLTDHVEEIRRLSQKEDYLGVRIVIKSLATMGVPTQNWIEVRDMLHETPRFGFDLLRAWEKIGPGKKRFTGVDKVLQQGAKLYEQKKYEAAFTEFQKAAKAMKRDQKRGNTQNSELYRMTLHLMAQSLFGAGRFQDALTVYSWLPPTYSDYRRAVFERMWAAFRAGKINESVGALASQYSSYFGGFIEPEAYLVQIYIYKKLCREADLQTVLANVKRFKAALESGAYGLREWLHSDVQTKPYLNIIDQTTEPSSDIVVDGERDQERERVLKYLTKRFERDKKRLLLELERVDAFTTLAFSTSSKELPEIEKLPHPDQLLKTGREMWPVDDAEDWLDEIGKHVFIGESQCAKAAP